MKDWLWSVVVSVMESDEALQREAKLSRAVLSLARTNRDLKERLELVMLERDEARDILSEYDLGEGTRSLDFVLANITAIRQAKAEGKPGPWEDTPVVVSDDARESLFAKLMSWPTAEAPTALLAQEAGVPPTVAVGAMLSMSEAGLVRYRNDGVHFWWSFIKCVCCAKPGFGIECDWCKQYQCKRAMDIAEGDDCTDDFECCALGGRVVDCVRQLAEGPRGISGVSTGVVANALALSYEQAARVLRESCERGVLCAVSGSVDTGGPFFVTNAGIAWLEARLVERSLTVADDAAAPVSEAPVDNA